MILGQFARAASSRPCPADETIPERVGEEVGSQNDTKGRFCGVPEFCNRLSRSTPSLELRCPTAFEYLHLFDEWKKIGLMSA